MENLAHGWQMLEFGLGLVVVIIGAIVGELTHAPHSVGGSNYHLQFTPKYRRRGFKDPAIRTLCESLARQKAAALGVTIEAMEFGPDHVHLFVTGCRKYSVAELVRQFKGYIAHEIRRLLPERMIFYELYRAFWSAGYFFESVGRVTSETVRYYIVRQQKKHWEHGDYDAERAVKPEAARGQMVLERFIAG